LSGGQNIYELLSSGFQGMALTSGRETILRQDTCFTVRRRVWGSDATALPLLKAEQFSPDLERFIAAHGPLTLVDLECTEINDATNRAQSGPGPPAKISALLRFQLANASQWQATGEWEIEWETHDSQSPDGQSKTQNPKSKIVGWRPFWMTTVQASAVAFADVTADAFGQDPSYAAHLLRDTNYWRAVLDEASGIDIFGNYGVSVGDIEGDGHDEIYMCQPQGLPNRLYRQAKPGVFEDIAPQAGVDVLDATAMALFADLLNRGRQDLILITQSAPLLFLNDGGKFTLARNAFPTSPQQASLTGAALGDYDRDGFLDLYVCSYGYFQGQRADSLPTPYYDAQNGPPNRLYRNRGDGTFVDVTTASGLDHGNNRYSFACVWADVDDDGWPDICVVNDFGRNQLYRNRRDGTFEEIIDGLPGYGAGMSAAFADLDGDGLGELYAAGMWQPVGERVTADPEFQQRFADVGVGPVRQFALGSNLYHPAVGPTGLRPAGAKMGAVPDAAGARWAFWNWCSDSFDLENDGRPDLYCLNGFLSSPTRDLTPIDAYFWEEVITLTPHANTPSAEYRAAWAASFELAHRGHPWDGFQRNVFFLNTGTGQFVDASAAVGLNFIDDGRSFAVLDYDGDGDADLVIHNRTGPQLRLLRNDLGNSNKSLAIRLTGRKGNRDAIGARVELETPSRRQVRFLNCGSGFLAQHSKELIFGLGAISQGVKVKVRWPSGGVSEFADLAGGRRYHLVEGHPNPRSEPLATANSTDARSRESDPPLAEPIPGRFSTVLVDPLPMPSLGAMRLFDELAPQENSAQVQPARARASHRYALLWLWDASEAGEAKSSNVRTEEGRAGRPRSQGEHKGLEALLDVQGQLPSRLLLWGGGSVPPRAAKRLEYPPWRANERFRLLCSTLLTYLFDHRRDPPLPTGLLFEVEPDATHDPAALSSFRRLVKVYWGGADAGEILRDARSGVKPGVSALPFPGRSLLCSFRRDFRSIGAVLPAVGFPGAAEIYLAQLVESSPGDAEAQYNLALSRRETGKRDLALSGVHAALAARPAFPEAQNLLAVLLMDSGRLAEAREQLERTTREAPDFPESWNNLGYTHLLQGDLKSARAALERALQLAPEFPDALDNLGIVMCSLGEQAKGEALFRRVLTIQPDNEQAVTNLGVLYAKQGKIPQAEQTFRDLLNRNPDASSAVLNLARLELSLRKTDEALSLLHSWLSRHPNDANARKLLEMAEQKQGR
jgi:Tfp pilus assembly protein PilF